jgi:hypothetical protein
MCLIFRLIKRVQITILLMLACNNLFCLDGLELILFFIFIRLIGVTVVELREHLLHLYFIIYHLKRQKKKKKKKKKKRKKNEGMAFFNLCHYTRKGIECWKVHIVVLICQ